MLRSPIGAGFSWVPGLKARVSQPLDEGRFSDEEILTVIRAGEAGMKLPELCKVTGITPETYYEWKAHYGGLTVKQMRALRERRRRRQKRVTVLAALVGAAVLGNLTLMLTRPPAAAAFIPPAAAVPVAGAVAPAPASPAPPSLPIDDAAALPAGERPAPHVAATATTGTASPPVPQATAPDPWADLVTADPGGVSVQVAAVPDLREAQAALEKLTRAGYPAHVTTKTVNGREMYRVRVGPLRSRQVADDVVARLKRDGYPSPWITR